ncbi:MAG: hydrolase, partial [Bacteroidota bacterium]
HNYIYTKLLFPTDVTFASNTPIPADNYYYQNINLSFRSNARKKLNAYLALNYGTYFTGKKLSINAELTLRTQPYGIFNLSYTRDEIILPFITRTLDLFGPKFEISFTRNLFFTTFFQYNTQANNFNINSRIQWRFRPMSDLFIVYSDNYYTTSLYNKNKGLVVKIVCWL